MEHYIEWVYGPKSKEYNQLINDAIAKSFEVLGIDVPLEVSIMIVDNDEIQTINLEQRAKDMPTDVLSFPMYEFEAMIDESLNDFLKEQPKNPETECCYLGDMVISWDKVVQQSLDYGHSIERELSFLVVHSILHMLGYDHMESDDEQVMIARQKEILEMMGMKR